jgi:hypothetical protein
MEQAFQTRRSHLGRTTKAGVHLAPLLMRLPPPPPAHQKTDLLPPGFLVPQSADQNTQNPAPRVTPGSQYRSGLAEPRNSVVTKLGHLRLEELRECCDRLGIRKAGRKHELHQVLLGLLENRYICTAVLLEQLQHLLPGNSTEHNAHAHTLLAGSTSQPQCLKCRDERTTFRAQQDLDGTHHLHHT